MVQEKGLVSVIIPTTSKELKMAEECALSIRKSTYKMVEIIIVNENKERSEQRNIGIDRSHGEYLMYLDSDQSVSEELIEECVSLMECGYSAIYIPEIITTKGWFGRLRNFERSFYDGSPVDCVRFFRSIGCPRFDIELKGPEDAHHDRRVPGLRTISKNPLYHEDGIDLFSYFRKKAYYTKSMKRYAELNPTDKVLDFKYRCFTIFVENGKWKKLLRHPILSVGIILVVFIRGIIYLKNK